MCVPAMRAARCADWQYFWRSCCGGAGGVDMAAGVYKVEGEWGWYGSDGGGDGEGRPVVGRGCRG
jgi:hypothetical protein